MERKSSDGLIGSRVAAGLPDRFALTAILLGLAGGAWLISARLATPDMRLGVLTGASAMPAGDQMGMQGSTSMGLGAFIATWTIMMAAMMLPSVVPAARAFDTAAGAMGQSIGATALYVAGYLLVWSAMGAVAYPLVHALQSWPLAGSVSASQAGAALLVVAGAYQLTPLEQACLRHCRSPHTAVVPEASTGVQGRPGAVRAGLWQGAYCLGSSWPLMLALLLVGMMHLAWMGIVTVVIFAEKVAPGGDAVSKVVGWALAGSGVILLAAPHLLPA